MIISQGQEFETPAEAPHNAICCFIADIGTQIRHFTKNGIRTPKPVKQVVVGYELEQKRAEGKFAGQPFVHYEFYTNSISSNAFLCKAYNAMNPNNKITKEMRDAGVDIEVCVGKRITLSLIKNDYNGKMKIDSVMPASPTSNIVVTQPLVPDWVNSLKNKSPEYNGGGQNVPNPQPQQFQQQHVPPPNQQYVPPQYQPVAPGNPVPMPNQYGQAPVTYSNQQQYVSPPNNQGPNGPVIPNQQNQVVQPPPTLIEDDLPF